MMLMRTLLALAFLPALLIAEPQIFCRLGPTDASYNAYADQSPSPEALELAGKVNAALRSFCIPMCPRISMFRNATASNLMLIRTSDQMKLVYKPAFFTTIYDASGDGAVMALLAHEVGHAIDGVASPSWIKSNWNSELRADAWAGCALGQMKLDKRSQQEAFTTLSKYPSPSHPDWNTRLPVIQIGYTQCGGK